MIRTCAVLSRRAAQCKIPRIQSRLLATIADTSSANYKKVFEPSASTIPIAELDSFARRHLGPTPSNVLAMLKTVGYSELDQFLNSAIPPHILKKRALSVSPKQGYTESQMLDHLNEIASKNRIARSFIGKGYYGTKMPAVIQRNLLESPEWYTSYTPYQPEISQGRLESLLNYQTMVASLTGLPMSNASLLDEGTSAAEAMAMSFHHLKGKKKIFVVDSAVHSQTLLVMRSRAENIGIEIVILPLSEAEGVSQLSKIALTVCGALVQYPNTFGDIHNFTEVGEIIHANKGLFSMATDLLALTVLKPPSEFGADIALGTSQRFGVPFGFGGPHAAFFATLDKFSRKIPGRIVGVSKDRLGNPALRLALQTREQHIKREKATSNICTAQALLANISAMYAVYHGPKGLQDIAKRVHGFATLLAEHIKAQHEIVNQNWFDTLTVRLASSTSSDEIIATAIEEFNINLFKVDNQTVSIAFDETVTEADLIALIEVFTGAKPEVGSLAVDGLPDFPAALARTDQILPDAVFNTHHSETAMLRYLHLLQSKDLSLANSMIPLGSCTMKLNATVEMQSLSIPGFALIHPFAPSNQTLGYQEMITEFEKDLSDITGFDATTSQPNSGAQGEYTGLSLIKAYHQSRGDTHRNICLIPVSAHGTNPASAAMCGLKVVPVKCLENGSIDMEDLRLKTAEHEQNLCCLMLTYPLTYGLFGPGAVDIIDDVHAHGGLVYLDGANMNAQVGLTLPGDLGADVCHLNIHKTFALSHGGGGPGQGPVCVRSNLTPFLPSHAVVKTPQSTETSIESVNSAPYGSAAVIPVSYSYIKMMGSDGLPFALAIAILNANYMLARLKDAYKVMFVGGPQGMKHCAHEFIIDLREFKAVGVEAIDVAKRLQDYGFHAPTMSFPVAGTLMIEPTELENKEELDRFVEAMLAIRREIDSYANKEPVGLVLKNAPHPLEDIVATPQLEWDARGYTREEAAYPLAYLKGNKCWPTVARVNDTYGDMNLMCTCPSVEEVVESQE